MCAIIIAFQWVRCGRGCGRSLVTHNSTFFHMVYEAHVVHTEQKSVKQTEWVTGEAGGPHRVQRAFGPVGESR